MADPIRAKKVLLLHRDIWGDRDLLIWLNEEMECDVQHIDDLRTGAVYCQLLHRLYPTALPLSSVMLNARKKTEFRYNFRLLAKSFKTLHVNRGVPWERLINGFGHNEFMNWYHKFYEANVIRAETTQYHHPAFVFPFTGKKLAGETAVKSSIQAAELTEVKNDLKFKKHFMRYIKGGKAAQQSALGQETDIADQCEQYDEKVPENIPIVQTDSLKSIHKFKDDRKKTFIDEKETAVDKNCILHNDNGKNTTLDITTIQNSVKNIISKDVLDTKCDSRNDIADRFEECFKADNNRKIIIVQKEANVIHEGTAKKGADGDQQPTSKYVFCKNEGSTNVYTQTPLLNEEYSIAGKNKEEKSKTLNICVLEPSSVYITKTVKYTKKDEGPKNIGGKEATQVPQAEAQMICDGKQRVGISYCISLDPKEEVTDKEDVLAVKTDVSGKNNSLDTDSRPIVKIPTHAEKKKGKMINNPLDGATNDGAHCSEYYKDKANNKKKRQLLIMLHKKNFELQKTLDHIFDIAIEEKEDCEGQVLQLRKFFLTLAKN